MNSLRTKIGLNLTKIVLNFSTCSWGIPGALSKDPPSITGALKEFCARSSTVYLLYEVQNKNHQLSSVFSLGLDITAGSWLRPGTHNASAMSGEKTTVLAAFSARTAPYRRGLSCSTHWLFEGALNPAVRGTEERRLHSFPLSDSVYHTNTMALCTCN